MVFDKQKQLDLFDRYQLDRSIRLRNKIAVANQGLVRHIAHRLVKQLKNVDFDDLFQIGFIGLVKSIERFDHETGNCFASYAAPCIRGEMLHYLRDKHDSIKLGRKISDWVGASKKAIRKLSVRFDRNPTDLEIATELEIELQRWIEIKKALFESNLKSLNEIIAVDGERPREVIDFVPDRAEIDRAELNEIITDIFSAIEQLPHEERIAIEYYYFDNMSRKDAATRTGVTPMTITRRLKKGRLRLRDLLAI
jgi:RNA polymerase sigma-B factor